MKEFTFEVGVLSIFGQLNKKYTDELKENYSILEKRDETGRILSEEQIADNIIGVLFAAQDTTASVLTWILKYLSDDPKLLDAVRRELVLDLGNDEKNATNIQRYLIPKGWKAMPLFRNIHHNPEFFAEPGNFDPFRFENPPKPYTYMPFGSGIHACPGNELAKLEMLVLLHHMLSKYSLDYRWELVGSANLI
ncbi:hypothetical protein L1987_70802 [Smallanthus sonchifolius]|uniref:Uncharacterized protein n=1 Tax=Smallanthus sonchifolius TaxID=185202 RepID=A0ACB9AQL4_9ASTR|nr:hypothetical protein L1987_70802 [Smallanthus sonchifolius]